MERRVQSLVDVLSGVYHFLQEQKTAVPRSLLESSWPLTPSKVSRGGADGCDRKARKTTATGGGIAAMDMDGASGKKGQGEASSGDSAERLALSLAERPPLKLLADADVVEALWSGEQSMVRRLLQKLDTVYSEKLIVDSPDDDEDVSSLVCVCGFFMSLYL